MSPNMAKQNHLTKNWTTDAINGKEIHCTYVSLLLATCETNTAVFIEKNVPCFLYTKLPLISASTTLRCMSNLFYFYKGKYLLWLPICFPGKCSRFKVGFTLKGKNLLTGSKFFSLKSWSLRWEAKRKELLPLKVYPFTLIVVYMYITLLSFMSISTMKRTNLSRAFVGWTRLGLTPCLSQTLQQLPAFFL